MHAEAEFSSLPFSPTQGIVHHVARTARSSQHDDDTANNAQRNGEASLCDGS